MDETFSSLTLTDLLARFASSDPTPGGGSAASIAGAMACALARMASAISAGKAESEEGRAFLDDICVRADALRGRLLDGADLDARAFDEVRAAYRLPKETDDEKRARKSAIQSAMKLAARVPLENAEACLDVARLSRDAVETGSPAVTTDAAVGLLFALTGVEGAVLNVAVNLDSIRDEDFVAGARAKIETLLRETVALRTRLWILLRQRLATLPDVDG